MSERLGKLAVLGGRATFGEALHVGRPNIGNKKGFLSRLEGMMDRRIFSNDGPLVREFEEEIGKFVGVSHCVATCNGTMALELAIRALDLKGEAIVPSYTFVATAHALQRQGVTPVFVDIAPDTHNLDPTKIEGLITPKTTAIVGVHLWGRPCDTEAIEAIASKRRLKVMYDAAHAFGCSRRGRMIGGFGACEIFSFQATKFLNSFEGGAVVTNDDALAGQVRLLRNLGFAGHDNVIRIGTNAKMTEVCAAMGLASLDAVDDLIAANRRNFESYREGLRGLPGISLLEYDAHERSNYQYVAAEVDPRAAALNRDELIVVLHAENVMARKYFSPGCHRMEPYRSLPPNASPVLPQTERVADRVLVLPTGQTVTPEMIAAICRIIEAALSQSSEVRKALESRVDIRQPHATS